MAGPKKNKELNLLVAMDRSKRRRKLSGGVIVMIVLIVSVASSAAFFYVHTASEADELTARRDAALSYVNDPGIKAQYEEAVTNSRLAQEASARAEKITAVSYAADTYPDMTSADYESLFGIAGKNVVLSDIAYDRATGVLNFSAMCKSASRVPTFISALRSCGIFGDVYYEGYSGGEYAISGEPQTAEDGSITQTQITVKEYSLSVTCLVNTDEQRGIQGDETDDANGAAYGSGANGTE
jgi:hypothetical protein